MTTAYYGPSDPEAKKFLFGEIVPNLGEMWGSKFANFAPNFLKIQSTDFGITQRIARLALYLMNKKIKKKLSSRNSFKSRSKF